MKIFISLGKLRFRWTNSASQINMCAHGKTLEHKFVIVILFWFKWLGTPVIQGLPYIISFFPKTKNIHWNAETSTEYFRRLVYSPLHFFGKFLKLVLSLVCHCIWVTLNQILDALELYGPAEPIRFQILIIRVQGGSKVDTRWIQGGYKVDPIKLSVTCQTVFCCYRIVPFSLKAIFGVLWYLLIFFFSFTKMSWVARPF